MFHRLGRHIKEGFIGVKRHFSMAISSASAVMITLTLVGFFSVLMINMAYMTSEVEKSISLVALIDYDASSTQIKTMTKQIEKLPGVEKIEYRTKDQEFDFYNEMYPDMVEFSEIYREDNPFHDTYIVYATNGEYLPSLKQSISKMSGISSVEDGGSNTYTFVNILESIRIAGFALICALVLLAVYLIYNTIKITIASRKDEIWIMRNVGAKNGYIRAPFLVEGIIIGILGSLIPIGLIVWAYIYLFNLSNGNILGIINLYPVYPFLLYLSLFLLGIGVTVGFLGSYISVCKYLRLKR